MIGTLKKIGLGLSLSFATASVVAMDELNFGIISTESQQNLSTIWQPFLDEMSDQLGMEINAYFAPDYAGIIQGMRFDKVDVAWFGNKSAMEAVDRAGGEIFAQTVDLNGNPGYWSVLVTHKDSDLYDLQDVIDNRQELAFGNGDPNSTSGFLVPSYYVFAQNDIKATDFKRAVNASHEVNLFAVVNKQVDVATNNTESLRRFQESNPERYENLREIWRSPLIPSDPIVWRKNLPESVKSELYNFFMQFGQSGDPKELEVLANLDWAPFKPSSDLQLLPIRQLELFKQRTVLMNKESLSNSDREELASINNQLAELNRLMAALEQ
ncbi:phosphonate ABC transporter substrate-binding protein [Salinibius halmophilus]|uniref:phosphonate ABC transporter substrate-binding protein n=1 Tax=Salinibius halmophilus TaxID=1853216 RepID=UPI000E6705CA|nr:phosphonate ABC transporter substrate-binding protein [Salinibius halmophilus]